MRRTLKNLLAFGLIGTAACTPKDREVELSEILYEDAIVKERVYVPAHNETIVLPKLDFDFNLSFEFEEVSVDAFYKTVFDGEPADFSIEGPNDEHKKTWEKFGDGEKARVGYRKKTLLIYDMTKAEKELKQRELMGYEFVEAVKINP
ncbi:MAG: hypothetical protein Q7S27_03860 [Nanoarchaeota archaeon]|nr:hypothetical protein [Nanoarchaeota archaeon]